MDIVPATRDDPDISAWSRSQPLPSALMPVPAGTYETPSPDEAPGKPATKSELEEPDKPKPLEDDPGKPKPVTETGPELDAALDKRKAETAATIKGIEENMLIMRGLMRPIAPPALPRFQDVPKSPDYQLRSGFEAFQNPLTWLAIGGSLLTRRPAIAAMGAAAGAMEGFHKGDNERVALEQKKFQDQMQAALEQNNKEVQFFNATMANKRFSAAERSAQIEAFFHQNQDLVAIDALKSGNYDRLFNVFKLRETLKERADEITARIAERREATAARREESADRRAETHRANLAREEEAKERRLARMQHDREMEAIRRGRAEQPTAAERRMTNTIDSTIDDIDAALLIMQRDPGVATRYGNLLRQGSNWVSYYLKGRYDADAATFAGKVQSIRAQIPGILNASRALKGGYQDISGSLETLQTFSTPQSSFEALTNYRKKLDKMRGRIETGEARAGAPGASSAAEAPPPPVPPAAGSPAAATAGKSADNPLPWPGTASAQEGMFYRGDSGTVILFRGGKPVSVDSIEAR